MPPKTALSAFRAAKTQGPDRRAVPQNAGPFMLIGMMVGLVVGLVAALVISLAYHKPPTQRQRQRRNTHRAK